MLSMTSLGSNCNSAARIVHVLGNVDVGDSWYALELPGQVLREIIVRAHIHAAHLNINGRRRALIQNGIDQTSRLKVGAQLGKLAGDPVPHFSHVYEAADSMILLEPHFNECRVHPRIRSK